MNNANIPILAADERNVLRELARQVAHIGNSAEMARRRTLWKRHSAMDRSVRPLVYMNPQGAWAELLPPSVLRCRDEWARGVEWDLRCRVYTAGHFASDNVVEGEFVVRKAVHDTGWGLDVRRKQTGADRGAFGFDPVIVEPADLKKLRIPEVVYDEAATGAEYERAVDVLGDILKVRMCGIGPEYHLLNRYTALRGLDQVMLDMYENPGMLHDAMAFFEEGHHRLLQQYVKLGVLGLNNDNSPIYTSGHGYTDELPGPGCDPANPRPCDLWCWAEAQEMAQVSPEHHEEFAFQYEKRLLAPFGLVGYGCCEDLTHKLRFVLTLPRLRRVSISPWADVDSCATQLAGANVIFMWKPQPAHLVGTFNEALIRATIRRGLTAARTHGCVLEMALLDTHTCENHPERFDRWSQIVREEIES